MAAPPPDYGAMRRDVRSNEPAHLGSEFAIIGLCIGAGIAGVYTEDVKVMLTIFLGGMGTWIMMGFPALLRKVKARLQASADAKAAAIKQLSAGAAPVKLPLPPADQVLNLIKTRRSIFPKDYTGDKVPKAKIEMLLEAANWAPTHNLTQPWRFTVIEGASKTEFEKITIDCVAKYTIPADKAQSEVERIQNKAKKTWPLVSHYIAISMARVSSAKGKPNPEWEEIASVSAAAQNLMLQATALGVACYWSSWQGVARDSPEMAAFLGLDSAAGDKCLGVIALGMSDRTDSYKGHRTPYTSKVTWKS